MKRIRYFLIFIVSGAFGQGLTAQTDIPVLTWRSHLSHNNIIGITASTDRLYAAAENALFYVDLQDFSVNKITKTDGLSDVSIGAIHYDLAMQVLIIGYANGNIDLIYDNEIVNIPIIKNAQLIGGKRFQHITVNNGLIYMANEQGIFVINSDRQEIVESYRNLSDTGSLLGVSEILFSSDSIYAATSAGILSASLSNQVNRQDFNNWQRNLVGTSFQNITSTTIGAIASSNNTLYEFDGVNWSLQGPIFTEPIRDLLFENNQLMALTDSEVTLVSANGNSVLTSLDHESVSKVLFQNSNDLWVGTEDSGLLNYSNGIAQRFSPPGPDSDFVWKLIKTNNSIYNLAGGYSLFLESLDRNAAISTFAQGTWTNLDIHLNGNAFLDLIDLEILENNSFNSNLFVASFQNGLINATTPNVVIDETRPGTTLQRSNGNLNLTAIASEGNSLWLSTYGFDHSIHQWNLETDTWESFDFGFTQSKYPLDILVLPNGDKWVSLDANRGGGILVFNETTGESRYLNTNGGQGGLPGREVTSMVVDQNFLIWVGTNGGIAFFPNPNSILNGTPLSASIPIFENSFLLRNEFITTLAIDPGNRKWIGTASNGLWLFSETGEELVHHFTVDNSPLLSSKIESIAVDEQTGEVFIGTANGLVSFRSDAIEGQPAHANVKVFPNPVTRDFTGVVTIMGLVNSAQLKITDASGKLVREIRSQGSSATWDARDYNGRRVKTGVYLVFSSNSDGTETYVSKIAVI